MKRVYYEIIKNSFQAQTIYRMNTIIRFFSSLMFIFIQVSIWRALYSNKAVVLAQSLTVSLDEMITYVIISTVISVFIYSIAIPKMGQRVQTGDIAMDLIKPISLRASIFSETLGHNTFRILFELTPLLVFSYFVFGFSRPQWGFLLLFIVSLLGAAILFFLITYIIGMLAFWYIKIRHFERMLYDSLRLLSGSFIPLWFFPGILSDISILLPFSLVYFLPISIYLQKVSASEALVIIAKQWVWIGILFALQKVVWTKAVTKIEIQGG
jgi:ABC-2 type transport system permease protein